MAIFLDRIEDPVVTVGVAWEVRVGISDTPQNVSGGRQIQGSCSRVEGQLQPT